MAATLDNLELVKGLVLRRSEGGSLLIVLETRGDDVWDYCYKGLDSSLSTGTYIGDLTQGVWVIQSMPTEETIRWADEVLKQKNC